MSEWGMGTEERGDASGLAAAFRMVRKEKRRMWPSYPLSGLCLSWLGFLVAPSVSGIFELRGFGSAGHRMEEFYSAYFSDCLFLIICAFLAVNVISGKCAPVPQGAFSAGLRFFRKLAIPAQSVVGSRGIFMLLALIVGALAFFLPAFLLSDLGAAYLWFVGIWIGYGLLASGFYLLLELTESSRTRALISNGFALSLVLVLAPLEWTLDLGLVGRTVELAHDYGPLPAILSILTGAAVLGFLVRATASRLEKRKLTA